MSEDSEGDFRDGVPFLGGSLWIDLLNTTPAIDGRPVDLIGDEAALRRWAALAGLAHAAPTGPADVTSARGLRAAFAQVVAALQAGKDAPAEALAEINGHLGRTAVKRRIEATASGLSVRQDRVVGGSAVAALAASDFADFLGSAPEPQRMKHCANPACTMVFYDRGKNNRRRWCSMKACGNRDKVANYRARKAGKGVDE